MTSKSIRAPCINSEWIGRAHCAKCHICTLMFSSELPDSAVEDLLQPIDQFLYQPGTILYEAGAKKKFIYSIRHGMVKLIHNNHNGDQRIVRLLGPGAYVGLELLDGTNSYHHTAVAVNPVDVCRIPASAIKKNIAQHPLLYKEVDHQLQCQLDLADQWITSFNTGTDEQRIAQLILILNEFFSDENGAFTLISREDIADITGTTIENIIHIITELKRRNILCKYKTKNSLYKCNAATLQELTL